MTADVAEQASNTYDKMLHFIDKLKVDIYEMYDELAGVVIEAQRLQAALDELLSRLERGGDAADDVCLERKGWSGFAEPFGVKRSQHGPPSRGS